MASGSNFDPLLVYLVPITVNSTSISYVVDETCIIPFKGLASLVDNASSEEVEVSSDRILEVKDHTANLKQNNEQKIKTRSKNIKKKVINHIICFV